MNSFIKKGKYCPKIQSEIKLLKNASAYKSYSAGVREHGCLVQTIQKFPVRRVHNDKEISIERSVEGWCCIHTQEVHPLTHRESLVVFSHGLTRMLRVFNMGPANILSNWLWPLGPSHNVRRLSGVQRMSESSFNQSYIIKHKLNYSLVY